LLTLGLSSTAVLPGDPCKGEDKVARSQKVMPLHVQRALEKAIEEGFASTLHVPRPDGTTRQLVVLTRDFDGRPLKKPKVFEFVPEGIAVIQ